jgi:ATP-dependent DNA helicase RecG
MNTKFINGPIPTMLNDTMDWLRMNLPIIIVAQPDGTVRDEHVFPLEALRELVANALVHRDLAAWAQGTAIEVVLEPGKFVITNPGGLFGISVDRLGREHVTSARNQTLVQLAVNARDPRTLARVVEALSDGLRTVVRLLQEHDLPPVAFYDTGIAFRAVLRARSDKNDLSSHSSPPKADKTSTKLPRAGTTMQQVYDFVRDSGPATVDEISTALALDKALVRSNLTRLRRDPYKLVRAAGGQGRVTTYEAEPAQTV